MIISYNNQQYQLKLLLFVCIISVLINVDCMPAQLPDPRINNDSEFDDKPATFNGIESTMDEYGVNENNDNTDHYYHYYEPKSSFYKTKFYRPMSNEIGNNGLIVLIAKPFKYSAWISDRNKYGQSFNLIDHGDEEKNAKLPQSFLLWDNFKNAEQDKHKTNQVAVLKVQEKDAAFNSRKNSVKLKFLNFRKRFFPL